MAAPVNIEAAMVAYLAPVAGVPVSTRVPNPRPASFVRVSRIGGGMGLVTGAPQVLVECWAATDTAAWALTVATSRALHLTVESTIGGLWVSRVDSTDPVNYPDVSSGSPRYQFIATARVALAQ